MEENFELLKAKQIRARVVGKDIIPTARELDSLGIPNQPQM
jgi:hypothetical protein